VGILRDLLVRVRGDKSQLDSTLQGAGQSVSKFSGAVKALGGIIAAAFSLGAIISFTKESMKLAAEAEGVKNAFAKLEGSKKLVTDLTAATRGMVDDSDLMALAIKAQNFKIPLKDLATYLEFATNRAITTGKSVSELTELIVTGLGRKSSRSFIQLGFAAKDVQEAMKSTGGMMSLVKKAMADMGPVADTMQVKFDRYATSVKNLKESWGEFVNKSKVINDVINGAAKTFERFGDAGLTAWQKIMMGDKQYRAWLEQHKDDIPVNKQVTGGRTPEGFNSMVNTFQATPVDITKNEKQIQTYSEKLIELNEKLAENRAILDSVAASDYAGQQAILAKNAAIQKEIDKLTTLHEKLVRVSVPGIAGTENITTPQLAPSISAPNELRPGPTDAGYDAALVRLKQFQKDIEGVMNELQYMVQDFAAQFLDAIGQALAGGNTKDLGKGLLIALANFMVQFGVMLLTTGLGLKAFAESMNNPENAGIAIAAGAALIIAGGAIKGLLSKGAKGGGGSSGGGGYSAAAMEKAMKIEVYGKIEGKDIAITSRRYVEDNG
jgi:hypothetical protein